MSTKPQKKNEPNPFISLNSIKCRLSKMEKDSPRASVAYQFHDETPRITVFPEQFLSMYEGLQGANSKTLLLYIMNKLGAGEEKIQLRVETVSEHTGIPMSTLYSTIDKLIEAEFIKRAGKYNMYWINPYAMFKGNRIAQYPEAIDYIGQDKAWATRIKNDMVKAKYSHLQLDINDTTGEHVLTTRNMQEL